MFLSLEDTLNKIAEIVNICLGPLGSQGFTFDSIRDFLIQMCSTLIIFLAVKFFLWKPITEMIEKRQSIIDASLVEAKEARERAVSLENKLKEEYNNSKLEIKRLLDEAVKEGNIRKEEIINEAKNEAKMRLENSKEEIKQEVLGMQKQIRQEIIDIAFAAASKIVSKEINPDKYLDVVDEILKEAK